MAQAWAVAERRKAAAKALLVASHGQASVDSDAKRLRSPAVSLATPSTKTPDAKQFKPNPAATPKKLFDEVESTPAKTPCILSANGYG